MQVFSRLLRVCSFTRDVGDNVVTTPRAGSNGINGKRSVQAGGRPLFCLSYVSTQCHPLSQNELLALLVVARRHNTAADITGLLLHREDSFFQILEGEEDAVRELFGRICTDPRHERIEVVAEGPIKEREFRDWQMAFFELDGQDLSALPGFSDLLDNTASAKLFLQSLSRSKKLAMLFSVMG